MIKGLQNILQPEILRAGHVSCKKFALLCRSNSFGLHMIPEREMAMGGGTLLAPGESLAGYPANSAANMASGATGE